MSHATRVLIDRDPYIVRDPGIPWDAFGRWPCAWVHLPQAGAPPVVTAYRRRFSLAEPATIRIHVSADERYALYLDGELIGRGSESGDPANWFFESYDLSLDAGDHMLVAQVWSLAEFAPVAQMAAHPGFLLAAEGEWLERLGTGVAPWEGKRLGGLSFTPPVYPWGTGAGLQVDGAAFPWGFEMGEGVGWRPVTVLEPGASCITGYGAPPIHRLRPAILPPMMDALRETGTVRLVAEAPSTDTVAIPALAADHLAGEPGWAALVAGQGPVTIPPRTTRRVIIDLDDYYCAYSEIEVSGGAGSLVRIFWAEALHREPSPWSSKGNRNEIEGQYFVGMGDTFLPDGGEHRRFHSLWWQAGRYVELVVRTNAEPLTLHHFALRETRYPLELESAFTASDPALARVEPILARAMQMCAHETYMDCPYYERLMYAGDARIEALTTYVMTRDDRLPRKALRMFAASRLPSGLTQSRYPSRETQIIPPFALWWVGMVHDYALWRGDRALIESLMPGVRAVLEAYAQFVGSDGLIYAPEGWNTLDWVREWKAGVPPDGVTGASGLLNWQFVYTLSLAADLEALLDRPERAAWARELAASLAARTTQAFWSEERGLLADDRTYERFSEHTQCMALLSGQVDPAHRQRIASGLLSDQDLSRTTIYFSHYLFEAYRALGRVDALFGRLGTWFSLEENGLKTTLESPEPSRSDCHAWGAHPLFHYFATILGIRPGDLGFRRVIVTPQLGPLSHASGRLVHPLGKVTVEVEQRDGELHGAIELPAGVTGELRVGNRTLALEGGSRDF